MKTLNACLVFFFCGFCLAQEVDLTKVDITQLLNTPVTSVGKKEQQLFRTASAIFVITNEDIRRSGATSIPEVLRMAPGLNVARIGASTWAVSARGFNAQYANKLLVLVDGRSVYSPLFSGVRWDMQDVMLEDIDRIEVIRGPGATLWGANAVNGVINIITRSAAATQGGLVSVEAGSEEHALTSARFGGSMGAKGDYRVFARYFDRSGEVDLTDPRGRDDWDMVHGGFRSDWTLSSRDSLTLEGDVLHGRKHMGESVTSLTAPAALFTSREQIGEGDLLARWTRTLSTRKKFELQAYYDRTSRDDGAIVQPFERRNTFDLDFQYQSPVGTRNEIVCGAGYRASGAAVQNSPFLSILPPRAYDQLYSAFIQDEIGLVPNRLWLTAGTKFEHNDYSGFEWQPNLRALWMPSPSQAVWAAVSSAARTPSLAETAMQILAPTPGAIPALITILPNPRFGSERLLAVEAGYRVQARRFWLDIAAFRNSYRNLRSREAGRPSLAMSPVPHLVVPVTFGNLAYASSYGAEISSQWKLNDRWSVDLGYSHLRLVDHVRPGSTDPNAGEMQGSNPRHQFQVQSHVTLPRKFELDSALYAVSRLEGLNVPAYARLDVRLGWRARESWEFSGGVQNALDARHVEFDETLQGLHRDAIQRSIFVKLAKRF